MGPQKFKNHCLKDAVSFSHGNGAFGTGTFRNLHSGFQPSLTSKTNNFSDGTIFFTFSTQSLKYLTDASSPSPIGSKIPKWERYSSTKAYFFKQTKCEFESKFQRGKT